VNRRAPTAGLVPLLYPKDRRRPELQKLVADCEGLQPWLAPKNTRRLQKTFLRVAAWAGLQNVPYARVHPRLRRLVRGSLHITLERFFSALDFLHMKMGPEDALMVSDGRDVILQADPFDRLGARLMTGQEEKCVENCPTNSGWILDLYGEHVARELAAKPILCSGVSLGKRQPMLDYLDAMTREIWRLFPQIGVRGYFDQAVHNWVIHGLGHPVEPTPSEQGLIATLGLMAPTRIAWDESRPGVSVYGKTPAIVHQYDRHPALAEKIAAWA
jgi:uncharacterized protein YjeT (DUF2065 family)